MPWTAPPPAADPRVAEQAWKDLGEAALAIKAARRRMGEGTYVSLGQGRNRLTFQGAGGFNTTEAQLQVSFANHVVGPFFWKLLHNDVGGKHDLNAAERSFIEKFRATLNAQPDVAGRVEYWKLLTAVEYVACKSHAKKVGKWDPKGHLRGLVPDSATSEEEEDDAW